MDTDFAPIDVANHWPFIRRHLNFERWPSAELALGTLAVRQVELGGQAVAFGDKFWSEVGLTPGETGRMRMTLVQLEGRGVIARYRGGGRRPHAWTFYPSLRHWDRMPWVGSGRRIQSIIWGCSCRAACPDAARLPGQEGDLSRDRGTFFLSSADHVVPPGTLPVQTRGVRAVSATSGQPPGTLPVQTRGFRAANRALYLSIDELKLIEEEERFAVLTMAFEAKSGQTLIVPSKPWSQLARIALRLTDEQCRVLAGLMLRVPSKLHVGNMDVIEDLTAEREVKQA